MSKIVVAGLINIETTLKIEGFPLNYYPVTYPFHGIHSSVSGVGYNVAKALHTLGAEVTLMSLLGNDFEAKLTEAEMVAQGLKTDYVCKTLSSTPQSVILYDDNGQRQIHVDLKEIQDTAYELKLFEQAIDQVDTVVLCNINFARPFIEVAKAKGKLIATDVHALSDIHDPYNADFMHAADILFLSHEHIHGEVEGFVYQLAEVYQNKIIVVGLGSDGALLYVREDNVMERFPIVKTRDVINTVGAGDSLFSCFVYMYTLTKDPYEALKKAMVFASYKIGEKGAAEGFLTHEELNNFMLR